MSPKVQEIINQINLTLHGIRVKDGIVKSLGRFEGEPIYVPYYMEHLGSEWADRTEYLDDGTPLDVFIVSKEDAEAFSYYGKGSKVEAGKEIAIWQGDQGFFYHEVKGKR